MGTKSLLLFSWQIWNTPTYIQEMISIKMDDIEILEVINQLKEEGGNKFDVNLVKSEFQKPIKLKNGNWSPKRKNKQQSCSFNFFRP